jgi:hypothetical protein
MILETLLHYFSMAAFPMRRSRGQSPDGTVAATPDEIGS